MKNLGTGSLIYAGIGSRSTPEAILRIMEEFAYKMSKYATLRSGGAPGADHAFYKGAIRGCKEFKLDIAKKIEIYLPWEGFNSYNSKDPGIYNTIPYGAYILAEKFHPSYNSLIDSSKKLMARNSMQVLGRILNDKVDFIICYTNDGNASGGTGQALRMAKEYNIKVYNLYYAKDFKTIKGIITDL